MPTKLDKDKWMNTIIEADLASVCSNLEVLSAIQPHDKLCIVPMDRDDVKAAEINPPDDGETRTIRTHMLNIDQRFIQSVRRYASGDSRHETIAFINHVIKHVETIASISYDSYTEQRISTRDSRLASRRATKRTDGHSVIDIDTTFSSRHQPEVSVASSDANGTIFVQTPKQVLDMLKTKLQGALKGIETLKTSTYSSDKQTSISIQTQIMTPANLLIRGIETFLTSDNAQD